MKFEEKAKILPNIERPIIYLLLDNGEVVYVGQSKLGLSRPYNHRDKRFTDVAIIECEENELDRKETDYIRKYKPKYNGNIGHCDISFGRAKEAIKKIPEINKFNIYDFKKLLAKLDIEHYEFNGLSYISDRDFEIVYNHVKNNNIRYKYGL